MVREREEACVEAEELAERMAQLKARHKSQSEDSDRRRRSLREELVRAEWAECRAEVVHRDAENVWGAGWQEQEPVAQTVYRLVGLSADEVRNVATCVSQSVTGREESVALSRLHNTPLED